MKNLSFLISIMLIASVSNFSQNDIREVDFQNFTYEADHCSSKSLKKITVKEGKFHKEERRGDYLGRISYVITGVYYGDFDGDGKEEAAVLSACNNTGVTGDLTEAYVYKMENGKPTLIVLLSGGDRAFGGLRRAWFEKGLLIVESNDAGESGAACCTKFIVTNKYRYVGGTLKKFGKRGARKINPPKRIVFDQDKVEKIFKLRMRADQKSMRFVIEAVEGKTLTVTKTSNDAQVTLERRFTANILEENKRLVAKLKYSGDYVFEIINSSSKNLGFAVTVTIR